MKRYFCITLLFMVFSQLVFAKDILDTIPAPLQGNWLTTDGSNRWTYGFTRDKVFYDCAVWQVKSVRQIKNHFSEIAISKKGEEQILFVKTTHDNNLWIGKGKNRCTLFSKKKTFKELPEEDLTNYTFKDDTAVYKGFIENYDVSWGKTGRAIITNPFIFGVKAVQSYLIKIDTGGSFIVKVPIAYPQQVVIQFPEELAAAGRSKYVYLFPGKTIFEKISNNVSSIFMGDHSVLNNEMNEFGWIAKEHDSLLNSSTLKLNPEQKKGKIVRTWKEIAKSMDKLAAEQNISKNAVSLEKLRLTLNDCNALIADIHYYIDSTAGERKDGKLLSALFRQQALKMNLSSLLNTILGNKLSLVNNIDYYMLINSLGFGSDYLFQRNRDWRLQTPLFSDLFYTAKYTPDDKVDSATIYANIDSVNKYVVGNNLRQYGLSQLAKDLVAASSKTNISALAKYDEPFEKIIKKYKGKTILVDFWGIGCVPCMDAIIATQKQRELMHSEAVVFLFLTNEKMSSLKQYNKWVPRIGIDNYRLNDDDWNIITTEFKIQGIPHYMIVDKDGKVVNDNLYFHTADYSDFRKVITQYMRVD